MEKVLLVALGGSLGTLCRYGAVVFAAKTMGDRFPWGTLLVNLGGCLVAGVVFGLADRAEFMTPNARLFLATGFLGALTTFSAFAVETSAALGAGSYGLAVANIAANNVAGLLLVLLGIWIARLF